MSRITDMGVRQRKVAARWLVGVLAAGVSLTACGADAGDDSSGASDPVDEMRTTLVMSHPQEPPNWNYWETTASALRVPTFLNVQETLVELTADGTVEPLLAESWDVSDDGTEYTFHLREATFHDGTELTAADVVYSLEINAESPITQMSTPLVAMESVEAVDDRTVRVVLSQPSRDFLQGVGLIAGIVVPDGAHDNFDLAQEVIGTGPYVFGDYRADTDLTLHRFDGYWGDQPYFEDVVLRFIPDETAALNALEAGDIDMVGAVLGEGIDRVTGFEDRDGFEVRVPASYSQSWLYLNTEAEVFQDERVRQAIAHAIDREPFLVAAVAGYGNTSCVYTVPDSVPYNTDYCPYEYDPQRSTQLLADAGYEDGLTIEHKYLTIAEFPAIMEVFVGQMADVGITVETDGRDLASFIEEVNTEGRYETAAITGSPALREFHSNGGRQPAVADDQFDSLLEQADAALEFDDWVHLMTEATNRYADLAWNIPLFNRFTPTVTRDDLVGFKDYRMASEMDLRSLRWAN